MRAAEAQRAAGAVVTADRLRASGCAVLWLTTNTHDTPLTGATVHVLTDPTTTARTIGHAATTALHATTR
ncbi:hypothetical protein [Actinophytocola sediminis]